MRRARSLLTWNTHVHRPPPAPGDHSRCGAGSPGVRTPHTNDRSRVIRALVARAAVPSFIDFRSVGRSIEPARRDAIRLWLIRATISVSGGHCVNIALTFGSQSRPAPPFQCPCATSSVGASSQNRLLRRWHSVGKLTRRRSLYERALLRVRNSPIFIGGLTPVNNPVAAVRGRNMNPRMCTPQMKRIVSA